MLSKEIIMSRPYRLQGENCFYHITSRGNGRQKIFISDADYQQFMHYLLHAKEKYNFYLYAFVFMGNHYHLLLETTQPNLARIMHYINSSYTTYYNVKRHKSGHLFHGRYKSILVDKDSYLLELTRYIHLNPVRAKLVAKPEGYKWTSYHGYIKKGGDGYIDKEQVKRDIPLSPEQYKEFTMEGITGTHNPLKDVYAGFILGKTSFIKGKLAYLKQRVESKDFSFKGELTSPVGVSEIMKLIARKYGKDMAELRKLKNHPAQDKKVAIYLLKRYSNLSNAEIGEHFGLSYSSVSKAAGSLEKQLQSDKQLKKEIDDIVSRFKG